MKIVIWVWGFFCILNGVYILKVCNSKRQNPKLHFDRFLYRHTYI